jgi:hypothetical protein
VDLTPLVTRRFALDDVGRCLRTVLQQQDGVMNVALYPGAARGDLSLQDAAVGAGEDQC